MSETPGYGGASATAGIRPNGLHEIWAKGGAAINGWLSLPGSFSAEVMAHQGWDSLTIDMQHGVIDYADMVGMLTAISTTKTVPIVRTPWLEPGIMGKIIDAGAYGIICPMIETADDVERFVSATSYAPRGRRSMGPIRAQLYGGQEYVAHANETVVRFAMIETAAALDNLAAILAVDGLDAVYIGPSDLSIALGVTPKFDQEDARVMEAITHVGRTTRAAGKVAGIHNGYPPYAKRMIDLGFNFVTVGTDAMFLADGSRAMLKALKTDL